jgi:hypothetical protein
MEELVSFIADAKAPHFLKLRFATTFTQLTPEAFDTDIVPVLIRILRKSSKNLPMLSAVVKELKFDLSPFLMRFTDVVSLV